MKRLLHFFIIVGLIFCIGYSKENNDFYDNTKTYKLKGPDITVAGEIENPGKVDLKKLNKHSVIVREAVLNKENKTGFVGSYRYDGYSLFDILKERYVDKKNKKEFDSIIDLLVIVGNDEGDKVVFSWGEIYYPNNLHRIIVATDVSPIIPTKSKDQWPIPKRTKLVCANDMINERNIKNPSRIIVISQPMSFRVNQDIKPLYSKNIEFFKNGEMVNTIGSLKPNNHFREYPAIFYGRGRGFHGTKKFKGKLFKSVLKEYFKINQENLRKGYFCISAIDGYRVTITFSELFNRNDNSDFLLIDEGKDSNGGRFRIYPTPDFFSDRAVKAITNIYFKKI